MVQRKGVRNLRKDELQKRRLSPSRCPYTINLKAQSKDEHDLAKYLEIESNGRRTGV